MGSEICAYTRCFFGLHRCPSPNLGSYTRCGPLSYIDDLPALLRLWCFVLCCPSYEANIDLLTQHSSDTLYYCPSCPVQTLKLHTGLGQQPFSIFCECLACFTWLLTNYLGLFPSSPSPPTPSTSHPPTPLHIRVFSFPWQGSNTWLWAC